MINELIASKSIEINVEVARVWEVLTNPKFIQEYLYGTETITDWKVGSEILFQGEYNGQKYVDMGVILETVVNELLSYSYWTSFSGLENKPENSSVITYILDAIDPKKTRFTWIQKGHASEENRLSTENQIGELIQNIKRIAEK